MYFVMVVDVVVEILTVTLDELFLLVEVLVFHQRILPDAK